MIFTVDGEVGDEEDFSVDVVEGLVDPCFTVEKSDGWEFAGDFFDFFWVVQQVGSRDSEVDDHSGSDGIGDSLVRTGFDKIPPTPLYKRGQRYGGGMDGLDDEAH